MLAPSPVPMPQNISAFRRVPLLVMILAAAVVAFALPATAQATPIPYLVDTAPDDNRSSRLTFDGDSLTAISMTLYVTSCSGGSGTASTSHSFALSLPAGAVPVTNGAFQVQGTAAAAFYATGSADYNLSGQLSADRTSMTGTVALTNATDPSIAGCSGTFSLLALPEAGAASNDRGPYEDTNFSSQFLYFDYFGGAVTRLIVQANFGCGTAWQSATLDASKYGITSIPTTPSGDFNVHRYIFDSYDHVLILDLTGHIDGSSATGMITISESPGFHGIGSGPCSGNYAWTAKKAVPAVVPAPNPPVTPSLPPTPTPSLPGLPSTPSSPATPTSPYATFEWDAVRIPSGIAYDYYFYVSQLKCHNSATEVRFKVKGRIIKLSCRKRAGWASHRLTPGATYSSSAQAVKIRRHKVVKRGAINRATTGMPAADANWQPISGYLGKPPG